MPCGESRQLHHWSLVADSGGSRRVPDWESARSAVFWRGGTVEEVACEAACNSSRGDQHCRACRPLRELYQAGGDPEFERFPASDELLLLLGHAERMAGELRVDTSKVDPKDVMGEAAVIRTKLWQYLRKQADAGQLKTIEAGRAVGMPWHSFNEALCVSTKHGAQQKAQKLTAEQVRRPDERRAPETARAYELMDAAEEVERHGRIARNLPRFPIAHRLCHQLLAHRDGLVVDGMSEWWLDDIGEVVDNRKTDLEKANLPDLLVSFVREVHKLARERNQPATTTDEARQALTAATEFVHHPVPAIPQQQARSQTGTPARRSRRRTRGARPTG